MQSTWVVRFTFIMLLLSIIQIVPADLYTRSELARVCLSVRSVFWCIFKGASGFAWKETKPCVCSQNSKSQVMFYSQKRNGMCEGECDSTQNGTDRGAQGAICTIRDYPVFCEGRRVCFSLFLSVTSCQQTQQKLKVSHFFIGFFCNTVPSTCDVSSDWKINRRNLGASSCDLFSAVF